MVPRFRGDSDDWLDDQNRARSRRLAAAKHPPRVKAQLEAQEGNATVVEVFPNQARVQQDSGKECPCSYRRAAVLGVNEEGLRERAPVAVGDRVRAKVIPGQTMGVIEGVCVRRNRLLRPAPDREGKAVHVIAANVDCLVIVSSACQPDFSAGLVDRFLVGASVGGIDAVLVVNKVDLLAEGVIRPWDVYQELDVSVFELSAKKKIGVESLLRRLRGKRVVFCGHSGVGKTSLLRCLSQENVGRVGEVNAATGKGRHTTTGAVLMPGPDGSSWIDTPGVREFGLAGVEPEQLRQHFFEFCGLHCPAPDCLHEEEAGCLARGLPRYESYRRILTSLREGTY